MRQQIILNDVCTVLAKLDTFSCYGIPEEELKEVRARLYRVLDMIGTERKGEEYVRQYDHIPIQYGLHGGFNW